MIYLVVLVLLILLAFRYDINGRTKGRDEWYLVMLVIFILIAGLRWRLGIDTPNYLDSFYHEYPVLEDFTFEDYPTKSFYVLINSFVKSLGGRFYMVQLIQAAFVNILIFTYIKRHSVNIFTCIFFYFLMGFIGYTMEIMAGSMSIVLCLFGNDFVLDKKWFKGYLLYILAFFFHAQTVVLFFLPTFFFLRFNKKGVLVMIGAFIAGIFIQSILGDYLELLDMGDDVIVNRAEKYAESDKYGEQGGNLNFFIVYILPRLIYGLLSLFYLKKYVKTSRLLKLEPFLMLGIMFLLLQMSLQIAYRYVDYYIVYFVLFISDLSVHLSRKVRLSKGVALIRTFIFLFPFIFLTTYVRILRAKRYYPYSSVIERKVDHAREIYYSNCRPHANRNEY